MTEPDPYRRAGAACTSPSFRAGAPNRTSSILHGFAIAAALGLALFALLAERTRDRGRRSIEESERAFDAGQLQLAREHARAAATAYVPGAEHVTLGYARLRAIARGAERARDIELASSAWRAMRAAATESGHLWRPHEEEFREADRELARLAGASPPLAPALALAGPRPAVAGGLVLGAAATLVGLWGLFGSESGDSGEPRWSRLRLPMLLGLLGAIVYGVALLAA
jgi:hypothetical protein